MTKKVAVWGTLREGHGNHWRMNEHTKIADDYLPDTKKISLSLMFEKGSKVPVEIYELDDNTYEEVDYFENMCGYIAKEVELESGERVLVWYDC